MAMHNADAFIRAPGDGKKWLKQGFVLLVEAVIFGIGIEVGKEIYGTIRGRRGDTNEAVPPPDDDCGGG